MSASIIKFIHKYFCCYCKWNCFLISFLYRSFLLYRKTTSFYVLILSPTLFKMLILAIFGLFRVFHIQDDAICGQRQFCIFFSSLGISSLSSCLLCCVVRNGRDWHSYLRREDFRLSLSRMMLFVHFPFMAFYYVDVVLFYSQFVECFFVMKW